MSQVFDFTVPGDPIPKGRPRVYGTNTITPARTVMAENRVKAEFVRRFGYPTPLKGPVAVSCTFWMASRRRKDFDNLVKLVTDALNGIAFDDDSQIVRAMIVKRLPAKGKEFEPHTDICIGEAVS